ncbi:SpoVG family protein [bacterium]|nr:SpoVG family protein [bacterium]
MEVTEIKISLRDDEKLCGFANIILDDTFVVRGLKIIRGLDRYFIAMPSRRKRDGSFADIAHPITVEFRNKMEKAILDAYWKEVQETRQVEMADY